MIHSMDITPSLREGSRVPLPSLIFQGVAYGVYEMKSDQFGQRCAVHPESIIQCFGLTGASSACRASMLFTSSATYTLGSVETCALVSVQSLYFFSQYTCFSACEAVHL